MSSPPSARPRRPATLVALAPALTWVVAALLVAVPAGAHAASTPAPSGSGAASPGSTGPPCPGGETRTAVTAAPMPGGSGTTTPAPGVTTLADGSSVTSYCALPQPVPLAGPVIASEHTVGGPRLAGAGTIVDADDDEVPAPPSVTDVSWTISDLDTGAVLAAKNPHALLLPASTLKTLLSLVALPALKPSRVVRASDADASAEGTRVGLVAGASYTVDQLFTGMVLESGNDTAYALAQAYGGTAKTLAAMNAEAARLGAWDTLARDPSGLDAPGQRSSAYDLALLGRAVMKMPAYQRYAALRTYTFPGGTDAGGVVHPAFAISNHNTLLANYAGAFGVKNGYTTLARHTFIGAAARGGHRLLVTEMGGVVVPSWQPSAQLLDWAFAHYAELTPVGSLVSPGAPQPPEWAAFGGAVITSTSRAASPTSSTASTASTSLGGSTPTNPPTSAAAPTALAGPGGEPVILVDAAHNPLTYVVLAAALLVGLGGWLAVRGRRT